MFSGQRDEKFLKERFVAEQAIVFFDARGEAATGQDLHVFSGMPGEAEVAALIDNGVGQRMVRSLLGCRSHAQEIVFGMVGKRMNGGQHGPADGERAGLVENDHVEMREALQCFAAFEQHAELRAAAHGNGERGGTARPMAQGQAMTSTATVFASASGSECVAMSQATNVISASPSTTGTKMELARSASRSMGAREPCACSTMRVICASTVLRRAIPRGTPRRRRS